MRQRRPHNSRGSSSSGRVCAALLVTALLVVTGQGTAEAGPPRQHPQQPHAPSESGGRFHSSFEPDDPAPDWKDSVETAPGGEKMTDGVERDSAPGTPGMSSHTGTGPASSPTAKEKAGFTGTHSLRFAGEHTASGHGYSYNRVFDVNVRVGARTSLSYKLFPELPKTDLDYPATHASLDLAFTDGTYLSDLGAEDQYGDPLTPHGQADAKTLYANQWNNREARIGAVAAGKTIDRILVAYDSPKGGSSFRGWVDDVSIGPKAPEKRPAHLSDYAETTRGTNSSGEFSRGNTFPATALPGGFNFWTPVTDAGSTDWLYEYARKNNADNHPTLQAFSASHEPSPWMGDRQTFQVMPSAAAGKPDASRKARALPFQHSNETARPHYYGVTSDSGLRTQITPTDHAAMMRFTFPGDDANLVFDNVDNRGGLTLDKDKGTVTGFSDVKSGLSVGATRMFVYARFDSSVSGGGKLEGGGGKDVTGYLRFKPGSDRTVTMRIATSLISVDQAKANLEREIPAGTSFGTVRQRAQQKWDDLLGRIEVEGATRDQLTTLYSSLYRLYLYPNSGSERVGSRERYASPVAKPTGKDTPTHTGSKIVDGSVYVNNGFWDTYRTTWPAYSFLTPKRAGKMADGFVQQYKDGGWISRWSSPGYADLMTGTSSDVAFADAYGKGVQFDAEAAYDAAVKNATVAPPRSGVGRKGMATSPFTGYTSTATGEGMSWALEGYLNDFGIARMGRTLYRKTHKARYKAESAYFMGRARNYVKHFDKGVGFFQGKDADGEWRLPPSEFDPRVWGHDYTETNGWTFAFTAPQDTRGLANLYGGRAALAKKLDTYFSTPETASKEFAGSYGDVIHEMTEARDTRMGMYGHSNQPSHHIAYTYDAAGQPWKAQRKVREVLSRLYLGSEIGQGHPGDEDNGEMSAWYVFSALGFYPLVMGSPEYAVGSPLFTKATVHLENGRDLVVKAPRNSKRNVYVQGLRVDGKDWHSTALPHRLLARGGTLEFDMGPKPSRWGTGEKNAPSSITKDAKVPSPPGDVTVPSDGKPLLDNTSATRGTFSTTELEVEPAARGKRVASYTLTSADAKDAPHGWKLEGSRDGKRWKTLDRRREENFRWDRQTRVFDVARPGAYRHYRLVPAGPSSVLSEIELLG
ncbi:GH92 family glycosyl hydrolase [Streptomyces nanshensis]|uniref:Alpha-mannosidase n=1 Tax=Streptomyces nanshensis TaxID=518642 RepID=A0A1E7L0L7_9ACTN|nr:GH92 family glycosyl hydrolase [Streptomyces nanshensis]OEV09720.1 alpha-mannosidase [Streptomyces nanshensis]